MRSLQTFDRKLAFCRLRRIVCRADPVIAGFRVQRYESAAAIVFVLLVVLLVVLPAVLVGGLFVWAALKDGQEDKALQARLGIRRRTRLGR